MHAWRAWTRAVWRSILWVGSKSSPPRRSNVYPSGEPVVSAIQCPASYWWLSSNIQRLRKLCLDNCSHISKACLVHFLISSSLFINTCNFNFVIIHIQLNTAVELLVSCFALLSLRGHPWTSYILLTQLTLTKFLVLQKGPWNSITQQRYVINL